MNWFKIENIAEIDSPSLALYDEHLEYNITRMLEMIHGETSRLMPHIKTNKMPKVVERMISRGITNFKASTIPEAEIAAGQGANSVLVAHQLVELKIDRFILLIKHFPCTKFSTIVDNLKSAKQLNEKASEKNVCINIYIDINNGMNRSGIEPGEKLDKLIDKFGGLENLKFNGLHVYDGHLRDIDFNARKNKIEQGFNKVDPLFRKLKRIYPDIQLICGGTPSFTTHALHPDRICSPGTCVFWDWGYSQKLTEQEFKFAALLITRVISKPAKNIVTIDLGHKSVASENPIDQRVKFLNLAEYELLSQSEEHGVLKVEDWNTIHVGDVLYGIPYHVCPTINLYDEISMILNRRKTANWDITARKRKINI